MKKLIFYFMLAAIVTLAGCGDKYDDAEVWKSINSLEQRISAMETVMKAYENKLLIKDVSQIANGYIITFTDGSKATIVNGEDGDNGTNGDTYIQNISIGENEVVFELTDGQKFSILLADYLSIEFDDSDLLVMIGNQTRDIGYTIASMSEDVDIEVLSSADIKAKIVVSDENVLNGSIRITTGDVIDEYSKVVVIVSNGKRVLMRRFSFTNEGLGVYDNTQKNADYVSGELELEFLSSVAYEVVIPDESSDWISYKGGTRAVERRTILLELEENPGYSRESDVVVRSEDGSMSVKFHIVQKANKPFVEASERQVLIDIYNSLGGESWSNQYNWCTDAPLGEWTGITVDDATGHITAIRLIEFDMAGEIPPSIGNLKELKSLHFYATAITKLPDEMGMLENLEYFQIGAKFNTGNHISEFPKALCSLAKLKHLKIYNHKISGIPVEFSQLKDLEYLYLSGNVLEGSVLGIICSLRKLRELDLSNNRLSGSIPTSIGNLSSLEYLNLGVNGLSGSIPAEIGNLRNLNFLYIGNNPITGGLPSSMANLSKLEQLHLGTMKLSGEIPMWIGGLKNLTQINLEGNNFSGSIPETLTQLSNLTFLSFMMNKLTGPIPAGLGNISGLETLSLSNNQLTGTIPEGFGGNLTRLLLYNNQLTGTIPESILKSDYWRNSWGQITVGNNFELDGITFHGPDIITMYEDMAHLKPFYIAGEYALNKYTILFQWSAGCTYLEDAVNILISLHNQYSSLGLKIIGRSFSEQNTLQAISKYNMPWTTYYSPQLDYPTYVSPTITVIDKTGMVVFTDMIQDRYDLPKFFETIFPN